MRYQTTGSLAAYTHALGILFLVSLSSNIIAPMIGPLFFSDQGLLADAPRAQQMQAYAAITAIYALGMIGSNWTLGRLADRYGAKQILLLTMIGAMLAYGLCLFSLALASFGLFFCGRGLEGLMAGRRAIALSQIARHSKDKINGFRYAEMCNTLGLFLGPLICAGLISIIATPSWLAYAMPYVFLLLIAAPLSIWILWMPSTSRPLETTATSKPDVKMHLWIEFFLFQLFWYTYFVAITPYIILKWHFTPWQVGGFFSGLVACYATTLLMLLPLYRRFIPDSKHHGIAITVLLITTILMAFEWERLWFFMLLNIIFVVHVALIMPMYTAHISNLQPDEQQGKVLGLQNSLIGIAWLCAAFLLPPLTQISANAPFVFCALLLFFHGLIRYKTWGDKQ